jgi:single-stranded DNA-binding protein
VNKVFLTGRLTRDPEMRSLASGKNVTTFTVPPMSSSETERNGPSTTPW